MNTQIQNSETQRKLNYGDEHFFGMYTDEGNMLVAYSLITIKNNKDMDRSDLRYLIKDMEKALAMLDHTEVGDTDVRMHVSNWVNKHINDVRLWRRIDYFYDDVFSDF